METQINFLTKKGFEKVKREYELLKQLKFAKVRNESPKIIVSDDNNSEYLSYYEDLGLMEIKLARLENILKNVALITPPAKEKRDIVDLGATVKVEVRGQTDEFDIVGSLEADPHFGKISIESPVGAALFGKKNGDIIRVSSPIDTEYKIIGIDYRR